MKRYELDIDTIQAELNFWLINDDRTNEYLIVKRQMTDRLLFMSVIKHLVKRYYLMYDRT